MIKFYTTSNLHPLRTYSALGLTGNVAIGFTFRTGADVTNLQFLTYIPAPYLYWGIFIQNGYLYFRGAANLGQTSGLWYANAALQANTWYQALVKYNFAGDTSGDPTIWAGGVSLPIVESATPTAAYTLAGTELMYFGAEIGDVVGTTTYPLRDGAMMGEIVIFPGSVANAGICRALTSGSMSRMPLMLNQKPLFYFPCDEFAEGELLSRATTILPNADVDCQWTTSTTANHYESVAALSDSKSIQAEDTDDGKTEEFGFEDPSIPSNEVVFNVRRIYYAKNSGDSDKFTSTLLKGASYVDSWTPTLSSSYGVKYHDYHDMSWTAAELNGIQVKTVADAAIAKSQYINIDYLAVKILSARKFCRDLMGSGKFLTSINAVGAMQNYLTYP